MESMGVQPCDSCTSSWSKQAAAALNSSIALHGSRRRNARKREPFQRTVRFWAPFWKHTLRMTWSLIRTWDHEVYSAREQDSDWVCWATPGEGPPLQSRVRRVYAKGKIFRKNLRFNPPVHLLVVVLEQACNPARHGATHDPPYPTSITGSSFGQGTRKSEKYGKALTTDESSGQGHITLNVWNIDALYVRSLR